MQEIKTSDSTTLSNFIWKVADDLWGDSILRRGLIEMEFHLREGVSGMFPRYQAVEKSPVELSIIKFTTVSTDGIGQIGLSTQRRRKELERSVLNLNGLLKLARIYELFPNTCGLKHVSVLRGVGSREGLEGVEGR